MELISTIFIPSIRLKKVTDITLNMLKDMKIDTILLDVDNTLACHGSQEPFEGTIEWSHKLAASGIDIVICSNNNEERVAPFAKLYNLPYVSMSMKPLPIGFNKAKKMLNKKPKQVLVVGDQIFTDILGANFANMKSVLLDPVKKEKGIGFQFKRWLEKPIRKKIKYYVTVS